MRTTNVEFIKRIILGDDSISEIRHRFFNDEIITEEEINKVISIEYDLAFPYIGPMPNPWDGDRLTLLPWSNLQHLDFAIRDTISRNIEGDFIETGVWKGGACILAKSIYNEISPNRKVYVADSFEGLPRPDPMYPQDANDMHYTDDMLKISLESVKDNFEKCGLLDDNVIFAKGWFKDTIRNLDIEKISILRLDGDMYESTIQVLEPLYEKLSIGGYCIVDDYQHHKGCKEAVDVFLSKYKIDADLIKVEGDTVGTHYWIKK